MAQYKLRKIVTSNSKTIYGVTIPSSIAQFQENTLYSIIKSGNDIILKSGTEIKITKEDIRSFDLESLKI